MLKDSRASEARLSVRPSGLQQGLFLLRLSVRSIAPSIDCETAKEEGDDAEYDQKECPWVVSASCVCCLGGRKRDRRPEGRSEGSREGGQSHVIKLNLILLFPTSPLSPPLARPSARIPLSAPFHRAAPPEQRTSTKSTNF